MDIDSMQMSEEQFKQAISGRRFSAQTCEIARKVLVDGRACAHVAREYGLYRQRIYAIVKEVRANFLENAYYPGDWQRRTVIAPRALIEQFMARVEAERREWLRDQQSANGVLVEDAPRRSVHVAVQDGL